MKTLIADAITESFAKLFQRCVLDVARILS